MTNRLTGQQAADASERLLSWKSIAAYFGCDERTVKRWERERSLPVRRAPGGKRSGVFAYSSELESWLRTGEPDRISGSQSAPNGLTPIISTESSPASEVEIPAVPGHSGRGGPSLARWQFVLMAAITFGIVGLTAAFTHQGWNAAVSKPKIGENGTGAIRHILPAEAEELYLRGRYLWSLRTPDSLSMAIDVYTQAIVKDPSYAEAYAGLAESYELLPQFAHADFDDVMNRARNAADRAIDLNPNLAAAHRAKAFELFFLEWDISGSDSEFRRAISLDPTSPDSHHWYASTLLNRLEGEEAIKQIDEALRLNPTSAAIATDAALIHAEFRPDLEGSLKTLRELERTQPSLASPTAFLKEIYFALGDYPAYISELQRVASMTRTHDDIELAKNCARGWAQASRTGLLKGLLEVQLKEFRRGTETGFRLGQTYLLLGRPKEALPYFEASLNRHMILLIALPACGYAKSLAKSPGYAALFSRISKAMHGGRVAHPAVVPITFRISE